MSLFTPANIDYSRLQSISLDTAKTVETTFSIIAGLFFIVGGIGIFMKKVWGRKLCLVLSCIGGTAVLYKVTFGCMKHGLAPSLYGEFMILLFIAFPIYFLISPRIKAQFK